MAHEMTDAMIWGVGIGGVVGSILILLVIAALTKYVFFRSSMIPGARARERPRSRQPERAQLVRAKLENVIKSL